jgi:putative methyltransferase (TIGR04325 family)
MNIKDFVPPVLIPLIKRANGFLDKREYSSYSQAVRNCTSDAYESVELCNVIADKTIIHNEKLKVKPYSLNPTSVFLLAAINQYINIFSKNELRILDFGGACGAHYYEIKRFLPEEISLHWYVVETQQMVKSAIEKGLNNDELIFASSIENINVEIDIIHTSCALQYVSDPYEFLTNLVKLNANWMFFNRMMFNFGERDFYTVQKSMLSSNGPGNLPEGYSDRTVSYPHMTMSFQRFNSIITAHGYNNEWIFEELSGSYLIKKEMIVGRGLLYTRK